MREALSLKKKLPEFPCQEAKKNITAIEDPTDRLLRIPVNPAHKEVVTFQKRLLKYRDSILTFLPYHKMPPYNNGSERAVGNIKVKHKISGQFKSTKGADDFCVIRSVTDTLIKRSENVLQNLTYITKLVPE